MELTAKDLENAHENRLLNDMLEEGTKTYAYPIYHKDNTYMGIKGHDNNYYVVKFENMRPKEALLHTKIKNLVTQYTEKLTNEDKRELEKCHREVALEVFGLKGTTNGNTGR